MYKKDLALNNLQWLIYHKTKPKQSNSYVFNRYIHILILSNAKSVDGGNNSISGISFFNIYVIQYPKESSM